MRFYPSDFSLHASELCARFVLAHLAQRHPARWMSSPRCNSEGKGDVIAELSAADIAISFRQSERLRSVDSIPDLFRAYYFRGVVLDSHEGLVGWLDGRYPLELLLDLPSPDEMLAFQCEGRRYVTLMLAEDDQLRTHGRHADACDFLLHDLEHAHKFFGDGESHCGQVRFFRCLRASLSAFSLWRDDEGFTRDMDYLKSDMNSHPVHLVKYLKAVVLAAEMRRTGERFPDLRGFWMELFAAWNFTEPVLESALAINHPEIEKSGDLIAVSDHFCGNSLREASLGG